MSETDKLLQSYAKRSPRDAEEIYEQQQAFNVAVELNPLCWMNNLAL